MGQPRFTPQCHWGSCLVGRRCPGEEEREKVGLATPGLLPSSEEEPPPSLIDAAVPAGPSGLQAQGCRPHRNEQLSSFHAPG